MAVTRSPLASLDSCLNTTSSVLCGTKLAQDMFEFLLPNNSDRLHPSLLYNWRRYGATTEMVEQVMPFLTRPAEQRSDTWVPPTPVLGVGASIDLPHYRFKAKSKVDHPRLGHCSVINETCAVRGDLDTTWQGWDHRRGSTKEQLKQRDRIPWYVNVVLWIGPTKGTESQASMPLRVVSIWCAQG